jgi:hypothetical protein
MKDRIHVIWNNQAFKRPNYMNVCILRRNKMSEPKKIKTGFI